MSRSPSLMAALALALLGSAAAQQGQGQEPVPPARASAAPLDNPFLPFDRAAFEAAAKQLGATAAQLQKFADQIPDSGLARSADDLLRAAVPTFDAAVELHEAGDPVAALELTKVLAAATDPLLQAHVRYHLARVFLDSDDPEHAIDMLNAYFKDNINRSPLDGEAAFFYAQALADVPLPMPAVGWYRGFLQHFPDASERFRSAAHQRIGEIVRQQESDLHKLADGMKKTKRDLRRKKTDIPVQKDQEEYIKQLDALIEEFEKREQQSSGSPSGNGPSSNPANNSALVEGDGSVGQLNKKPSLADRWGEMKDRDREKIATEVQKGLPPEYQKMLEEYYKKLGKAAGQ
jgi:tetratricopeptide (TPR) repeat protein